MRGPTDKICRQYPNPVQRLFEGKTVAQIQKALGIKGELGWDTTVTDIYNQTGGDGRVDAGQEVALTARFFVSDAPAETKEHGFGKYAHLVPAACNIKMRDIDDYVHAYLDRKLAKQRPTIAKDLGISQVKHPFADAVKHLHADAYPHFRGMQVFEKLANTIRDKLPEVAGSKTLKMLYPGSGAHAAPLMTALNLMDQGVIISAQLTYTDIDEKRCQALFQHLTRLSELGVFEGKPYFIEVPFNEPVVGAKEVFMAVQYKGKPIVIRFALNRSGTSYYRPEYLQDAHVVIIHDPGNGPLQDSIDLANNLRQTRGKFGIRHKQLLIMEGQSNVGSFSPTNKKNVTEIPGQYGHCQKSEFTAAEIGDCSYSSAFVLDL